MRYPPAVNRARLKALLDDYGTVALLTYFVLFVLVFSGASLAISLGFNPKGAGGTAGLLGAAYLATKATQPLRIGATIVLTPLLARALKWWRGRRRSGAPAIERAASDAGTEAQRPAPNP